MKILGLDTSTSRLSIALWEQGVVLGTEECIPEKRHAEAILPAIEKVLLGLNLTPKDIGGLAVGLGPGTFTGLRVGLATAQGMAQALSRPLAGVSSFLAAAAGTGAERALVLEDARQDKYYAAAYEKQEGSEPYRAVFPEQLTSLEELLKQLPAGPWKVTGPAAEKTFSRLKENSDGLVFELVPSPRCLPRGADIAALAEATLKAGGTAPEDLAPLYLRRTQAEETQAARKPAVSQDGAC